MSSENIPEIGDKRGNFTLVARGDDFPDEWDGWLDELLERYGKLVKDAASKKLHLEVLGLVEGPEGLKAFAEQIGVAFEQEFWEGACISGQYQLGWIRTSEIRRAQRGARQLLAHIEQKLTESCKT
jgi:hypothetical protein